MVSRRRLESADVKAESKLDAILTMARGTFHDLPCVQIGASGMYPATHVPRLIMRSNAGPAWRGEAMMILARATGVEKFSEADLAALREELLRSNLDSWQAADLISHYLT